MKNEVEGIWKKAVCGIFPEELRKATKNISQDSQSPDREFNPGPHEYEAGSCVSFQQ